MCRDEGLIRKRKIKNFEKIRNNYATRYACRGTCEYAEKMIAKNAWRVLRYEKKKLNTSKSEGEKTEYKRYFCVKIPFKHVKSFTNLCCRSNFSRKRGQRALKDVRTSKR